MNVQHRIRLRRIEHRMMMSLRSLIIFPILRLFPFKVRCWTFDVRCSSFQCSMLDVHLFISKSLLTATRIYQKFLPRLKSVVMQLRHCPGRGRRGRKALGFFQHVPQITSNTCVQGFYDMMVCNVARRYSLVCHGRVPFDGTAVAWVGAVQRLGPPNLVNFPETFQSLFRTYRETRGSQGKLNSGSRSK